MCLLGQYVMRVCVCVCVDMGRAIKCTHCGTRAVQQWDQCKGRIVSARPTRATLVQLDSQLTQNLY